MASGGGCTDASRACLIEAGSAYVAALESHDDSAVPLAPNVRRTENGLVTASSDQKMRDSIEHGQVALNVTDVRDVRWFADLRTSSAIAYYMADTGPVVHASSVWLAERFRVVGGRITEIEALFWAVPRAHTGTVALVATGRQVVPKGAPGTALARGARMGRHITISWHADAEQAA